MRFSVGKTGQERQGHSAEGKTSPGEIAFPENDYALPAARSQPAISSLLGIRPATLTASSTTKAGVVMIG